MKSGLVGLPARARLVSALVAFLSFAQVSVAPAAESASAEPQGKGLRSEAIDPYVFISLTELRPEWIARQAAQIWVLARIQPKSQEPVDLDMIIDPKTGKVSSPPIPTAYDYAGIVAVVSGLTGPVDRKVYDYAFVLNMMGTFDVAVNSRPFTMSGLCICRIDGTKSGIDRFRPVDPIPDNWSDWVVPAFASFRAPDSPFSQAASATNRGVLSRLLTDVNPLIVLTAYRILLEGGETDDRLVQLPFRESDLMEQSVLLYLLFSHLREAWWPRVIEHVRQMANSAGTAEQLEPLRLAAGYAWQRGSVGPPVENHSQEILACLQSRAAALGPQSPGAEDLRRFLHRHGMDPVYANGPGVTGH